MEISVEISSNTRGGTQPGAVQRLLPGSGTSPSLISTLCPQPSAGHTEPSRQQHGPAGHALQAAESQRCASRKCGRERRGRSKQCPRFALACFPSLFRRCSPSRRPPPAPASPAGRNARFGLKLRAGGGRTEAEAALGRAVGLGRAAALSPHPAPSALPRPRNRKNRSGAGAAARMRAVLLSSSPRPHAAAFSPSTPSGRRRSERLAGSGGRAQTARRTRRRKEPGRQRGGSGATLAGRPPASAHSAHARPRGGECAEGPRLRAVGEVGVRRCRCGECALLCPRLLPAAVVC